MQQFQREKIKVSVSETRRSDAAQRLLLFAGFQRIKAEILSAYLSPHTCVVVFFSAGSEEHEKKTFLLAIGIVAVVVSFLVILSAAVCIHRKNESSKHREHEHCKHRTEKDLI